MMRNGRSFRFKRSSIVRAQSDGKPCRDGLPDTARVITIGQGSVNDGDTVGRNPDERDATRARG